MEDGGDPVMSRKMDLSGSGNELLRTVRLPGVKLTFFLLIYQVFYIKNRKKILPFFPSNYSHSSPPNYLGFMGKILYKTSTLFRAQQLLVNFFVLLRQGLDIVLIVNAFDGILLQSFPKSPVHTQLADRFFQAFLHFLRTDQ